MKYFFLSGGLGNQMFEYAFVLSCRNRGISIMLNRDLYYVNKMHHGYLLDYAFGISEDEVVKSNKLRVFISRVIRRYHPLSLVYSDMPMTYNEKAWTTRRVFYDGCFINPKYFEGIESIVRDAFTFQNIDSNNRRIGIAMQEEESVSIHIRRGDFLNNPIYDVCNENYYMTAINYIRENIASPIFYVFSDDHIWSDRFMKKFDVVYNIIDHNNGIDSFKDMYLMSKCRHNIIANSTFSWWGAWLNGFSGKLVLAPNKWTTTFKMEYTLPNWVYIEI